MKIEGMADKRQAEVSNQNDYRVVRGLGFGEFPSVRAVFLPFVPCPLILCFYLLVLARLQSWP